jgi:hypothetical protein
VWSGHRAGTGRLWAGLGSGSRRIELARRAKHRSDRRIEPARGAANATAVVAVIADNIERLRDGRPLLNQVHPPAG